MLAWQGAAVDQRDIRAVIETLFESWNRRDWPAFGACFSEEASYVTGEAVRWSGRGGIEQGMPRLLASGGTGGNARVDQVVIRPIGKDVAIAHLGWRLAEEGPAQLAGGGTILLVLARHRGAWLIEAAQNTDLP